MKKNAAAIVLCYISLYLVWGSTYLAIRYAVAGIPVFYVVVIRYFVCGLVFLAIAAATGKFLRRPSLREVLASAFMGLFLLIGGNGFVSLGERTVDSHIAAIIVSSTPFCVAFFNRIIFRERLHWARLVGIGFGVLGVVAVLWKGEGAGLSLTPGVLFVIAGFLCWGFATSMAARLHLHADSFMNSGLEMTIAGSVALIGSFVAYGPPGPALAAANLPSLLGLGYLTVFGGATFYAYTYLLKHEPSIRVVSYSIVNPLVAVLLGMVIAGERPTPLLALGVPIILAGLVLMLYGERIFTRGKRVGEGS